MTEWHRKLTGLILTTDSTRSCGPVVDIYLTGCSIAIETLSSKAIFHAHLPRTEDQSVRLTPPNADLSAAHLWSFRFKFP